jgi:hypothetical protein
VQRSADVDSDGGGKQRVAWAVLVPDFHVDCGGVADGALDEDFHGDGDRELDSADVAHFVESDGDPVGGCSV